MTSKNAVLACLLLTARLILPSMLPCTFRVKTESQAVDRMAPDWVPHPGGAFPNRPSHRPFCVCSQFADRGLENVFFRSRGRAEKTATDANLTVSEWSSPKSRQRRKLWRDGSGLQVPQILAHPLPAEKKPGFSEKAGLLRAVPLCTRENGVLGVYPRQLAPRRVLSEICYLMQAVRIHSVQATRGLKNYGERLEITVLGRF